MGLQQATVALILVMQGLAAPACIGLQRSRGAALRTLLHSLSQHLVESQQQTQERQAGKNRQPRQPTHGVPFAYADRAAHMGLSVLLGLMHLGLDLLAAGGDLS